MSLKLDVLIVDDELDIRNIVSDILEEEGYNARAAKNSTEAFDLINKKVPNAVILDIWLQNSDLDGLSILEQIKKRYPLLPVVIISGHGTIQTAISAIKLGAYDYIEKPFTQDKLTLVLKRACEAARLKKENTDLKLKTSDNEEIIGSSHQMFRLKHEIEKIAPTSSRVLITGAIGSGKELAAKLIHKKSKYSKGSFVVFCPTGLSKDRVNQELFGDLKDEDVSKSYIKRLGALEVANGGTLYIDEVTDLPLEAQTRLIKVMQYGILEKQDGSMISIDTRIISASYRDLLEYVNKGTIKQDFYYRISVSLIKVPNLEERKDDITDLVDFFASELKRTSGIRNAQFSKEAILALQAYNWPGNVRQLKNAVEWALIMNSGSSISIIRSDMLPHEITNNTLCAVSDSQNKLDIMTLPLREAREMFEKQYLAAQMSRFNNNISRTSAFVGMERSALHRKLKVLNIHTNTRFDTDESNFMIGALAEVGG